MVLVRLLVERPWLALRAQRSRRLVGPGPRRPGTMAFVVRSARVVDQKLAEARARLRRVEPEERLRVFVGRGPAEGGGRRSEARVSPSLVAEGPRDYDHQQDDEEDRVEELRTRGWRRRRVSIVSTRRRVLKASRGFD